MFVVLSVFLHLRDPYIYQSFTMPHPSYCARQQLHRLHGDEYYVVSAYEDHAENCSLCANPSRCRLCQRGHYLARDVNNYLYKNNGRVFSTHSHRYRHCHELAMELDLPRSFHTVHRLLSAVENGLCLKSPLKWNCGTSSSGVYNRVEIIERRPRHDDIRKRIIQRSWLIGKREFILIKRVTLSAPIIVIEGL